MENIHRNFNLHKNNFVVFKAAGVFLESFCSFPHVLSRRSSFWDMVAFVGSIVGYIRGNSFQNLGCLWINLFVTLKCKYLACNVNVRINYSVHQNTY